jgi:ubiquinone/menaquinone biosynthesis C-methylase UbiE
MQTPHFTGTIPRNYDDYMGPMFFEDYAIEIANRVDPSSVKMALELSCGTGRVTNHLRSALLPASTLVASDISSDMLAVAQQRLKDRVVEWRSIDFNNLPFENESVDLVVCSFGYMFSGDKVRSFQEALRVLRKGGSLIMSTWDKLEYNEASNVFRTTVKRYFGDTLPPTYGVPYSMHDGDVIRRQLTDAGFSKIDIDVVEKKSVSATARLATIGMVQGGSIYHEIIKRDPSWLEEISESVEKELTEKYGASPMVASMRALITQAWK